MKNNNVKLEKMLVKRFCFFSFIIVILFAAINIVIRIFNDYMVVNTLEEQYIVDCEGGNDYEDINIDALKDIGGWFEIIDTDYNIIYPSGEKRKYYSGDITNIVNGDYSIQGKFYQGMLENFNDGEGNERIQISFFPCDVLDVTPTINIPVKIKNAIKFLGIYIIAFFVFVAGYAITVFAVSRKIKMNLLKPINELRIAMREFGNGNYEKQLTLDAKAEYEFIEMGNSFNCMALAMKNAVKKKEEEEFLRRQLISDISHDIRTPLTVIQGYLVTILNMTYIEEKQKHVYLEQCYKSSLEINKLLEQLSDYNRMMRIDYKLNLELVDLTEFLTEILIDQYHKIEFAEMELIVEYAEKERMVNIDKYEMQRAIINLINNVIQHNLHKTKIFANIIDTKTSVNIVIADSGALIPEDIINRMFEPFIRGEQSRNDYEHSGLGLAIVKRVIDAHGGEILFEQPYQQYSKAFLIEINKVL